MISTSTNLILNKSTNSRQSLNQQLPEVDESDQLHSHYVGINYSICEVYGLVVKSKRETGFL